MNLPPGGSAATWPPHERFLLAMTTIGFIAPNVMLVAFIARHGFDVARYFNEWFRLLPSAQLSVDLAISAVAFLAWTSWDGPRTGVRRWWVGIPATFLVGVCFAVPLYLLLRERAHARQGSAAI
jgi:hypothetical protein